MLTRLGQERGGRSDPGQGRCWSRWRSQAPHRSAASSLKPAYSPHSARVRAVSRGMASLDNPFAWPGPSHIFTRVGAWSDDAAVQAEIGLSRNCANARSNSRSAIGSSRSACRSTWCAASRPSRPGAPMLASQRCGWPPSVACRQFHRKTRRMGALAYAIGIVGKPAVGVTQVGAVACNAARLGKPGRQRRRTPQRGAIGSGTDSAGQKGHKRHSHNQQQHLASSTTPSRSGIAPT